MNAIATEGTRLYRRADDLLAAIPASLALFVLRVALAVPFFRSGLTKFDGFLSVSPGTRFLFANEFKLHLFGQAYAYPFPLLMAWAASIGEIVLPVLLVVGLFTRFAALGLFVMTIIIQLTIPAGWANFHLPWAAMALALTVIFVGSAATAQSVREPAFQGFSNGAIGGDNLGNHTATENLNLSGFRLTGVGAPGALTDGVNVEYLNQRLAGHGDDLGNHVANRNLNLSGYEINNVGDPSTQTSAVNLRTLQSAISSGGDNLGNHTASLPLNLNNQRIFNLADPNGAQHAVNLRTLENRIAAITGDHLGNHIATRELVMSSFRITNMADPSDPEDGVNLRTVEALIAAIPEPAPPSGGGGNDLIAGSGITISGDTISVDSSVVRTTGNQTIGGNKSFTGINSFGGQRITNVADPVGGMDVANRRWVENQIGAIPATPAYTGGTGISISGSTISFDQVWGDGRYALATRSIAGGDGLTGGGNLSANRTLSVDSSVLRTSQFTSGPHDATEGRIPRVRQSGGFFGIGGTVQGVPGGDISVTDNSIFTGLYRYDTSAGDTGGPGGVARASLIHTRRAAGGGETQLMVVESGPNQGEIYTRARVTGSWSSWRSSIAAAVNMTAGTGISVSGQTISFDQSWGDGRYALRSRTINAGTGLTGGGNLQANRTLNFDTNWGDDRYTQHESLGLTGTTYDAAFGVTGNSSLTFAHAQGGQPDDAAITSQVSGLHIGNTWGRAQVVFPNTGNRIFFRTGTRTNWNEVWHNGNFNPLNYLETGRRILTGTGLIGGGDLTSDRTISFDTAWGDGRYALRSRTLTAGDVLSGGGNLQGNRTFAVDGTVVRTSGNQTIQGTKTFGNGNGNAVFLNGSAITNDFGALTISYDSTITGQGNNRSLFAWQGKDNYIRGRNTIVSSNLILDRQATTWQHAVRAGRTLSTGTGITGGGDLTADRTLSFDTAWGDGRYALRSRTLTAGTGLTGGGNLQGNRTFNLQNIAAG